MSENMEREAWLCRSCNTLVSNDISICPACSAERPEEVATEPIPEGIESVIKRDNYTNAEPRPKSKYIFREAVLVNAGDILLVLGLFCTFGALIAPIIIDFGVDAPMIWATCGAVVIFAITMITWATLRTLAEISRMLRNRE
ncbi:MAG: hypothetical protein IKV06_01545 [Alistipes sp.]|nr:hypothetical protein [Alistipes sp.]